MNQFGFLTSNRFWAIVIGAVSIYLQQKGYFGDAEMLLVTTVTALFVGVRTIDRTAEVISNRTLPVDTETKKKRA